MRSQECSGEGRTLDGPVPGAASADKGPPSVAPSPQAPGYNLCPTIHPRAQSGLSGEVGEEVCSHSVILYFLPQPFTETPAGHWTHRDSAAPASPLRCSQFHSEGGGTVLTDPHSQGAQEKVGSQGLVLHHQGRLREQRHSPHIQNILPALLTQPHLQSPPGFTLTPRHLLALGWDRGCGQSPLPHCLLLGPSLVASATVALTRLALKSSLQEQRPSPRTCLNHGKNHFQVKRQLLRANIAAMLRLSGVVGFVRLTHMEPGPVWWTEYRERE